MNTPNPYPSLFSPFQLGVAFVAYATPRIPEDALGTALRAAGIEVHPAGDCALPQGLLAATAGGYAAGMAL